MRAPSVSIVVPCRDAGPFLEEALRSVRAQTHRDWELLFVDDGSEDQSAAIVRRHAARDPEKVRLLAHPRGQRRGPFASRLLGARMARSEVVALLDADDVWEPDYLRHHLGYWRKIRGSGAALSYGPATYWYPDGTRGRPHPMPARRERVYAPGELLQNLLSSGHATVPRTTATLIRRSALLAMGRFEAASRRSPTCEDAFLFWGIAARWPVASHPRALVLYRQKWAPDGRPEDSYARLCKDETRFLRRIRPYVRQLHPRHPILRPDGISARLKALAQPGKKAHLFGGCFYERIPEDLRRLAAAAA